jgi:hypothetical protein
MLAYPVLIKLPNIFPHKFLKLPNDLTDKKSKG